jgi:hypothetical protein
MYPNKGRLLSLLRESHVRDGGVVGGGYLIAEFYLVDRGLRHRLPGFSSLDRPVVIHNAERLEKHVALSF